MASQQDTEAKARIKRIKRLVEPLSQSIEEGWAEKLDLIWKEGSGIVAKNSDEAKDILIKKREEIKQFIKDLLSLARTEAHEEGWRLGHKIAREASAKIHKHKSEQAVAEYQAELVEKISNLSIKDFQRMDGTMCQVIALKDLLNLISPNKE